MYFYLICQFSPSRDAHGSSFIWCLLESASVIFRKHDNDNELPYASFRTTSIKDNLFQRQVHHSNPSQNVSDSIDSIDSIDLTICTADPVWAGNCDFLWKRKFPPVEGHWQSFQTSGSEWWTKGQKKPFAILQNTHPFSSSSTTFTSLKV